MRRSVSRLRLSSKPISGQEIGKRRPGGVIDSSSKQGADEEGSGKGKDGNVLLVTEH